jgi:hypothetical protein
MATENADQGVEISQADFDTVKRTLANCEKFSIARLSSDRAISRATQLLIRDAEDVAGQDGTTPILERAYHTEGYKPERITMTYLSPAMENGAREVCEEQAVVFVKTKRYGEYSWLLGADGKPLVINGDLYDSRIESSRHARMTGGKITNTVPQLDNEGNINGIITLFDQNPGALVEQK